MSEYNLDLPKILEALNTVDIKVLYFITLWLVIWKVASIIKITISTRNKNFDDYKAENERLRPSPPPPPPPPPPSRK